MRNQLLLAALGVATSALLVGAGVATGASHSSSAARVVISTRKIPKLGTILVDGRGRTLYMFVPDKRKRVTCVHTCAVVWPPVKLVKGARAVGKGKARRSLLGSDPNPVGARVVTYDGWPLYRYLPWRLRAPAMYAEKRSVARFSCNSSGFSARSTIS